MPKLINIKVDMRPILDDLKMMVDVLEGLKDSIVLLEESAALFDKYANYHIEKGTPDSHAKALVNVDIAERIKDRLSGIAAALDRYNA